MEPLANTAPLTVVEVAMEIAFPPTFLETVQNRFGLRPARDVALSTSVGGIGPLLRDRLIAQAEKGIHAIGVTLLYETTWIQSWFQWGQLHLEKREVALYLRELLQDSGIALPVTMFDGHTVNTRVWQIDFGQARVYFLDCPPITQVVYPSEEDAPPKTADPVRWAKALDRQQRWLIGRGTLGLLKALNQPPDVILMSETPTFFAHHRLALDAFHQDPFFERTRYIFNDHTPMEYAHPVWGKDTLASLKVDVSAYTLPSAVETKAQTTPSHPAPSPSSGEGRGEGGFNYDYVDVTRLLIGAVDGVFGVSQKHVRGMQAMPSLKDFAAKIETITNGVSVHLWQAPEFRHVASMDDVELLRALDQKKADLLDWVWRHSGLWHTWKEQVRGKDVIIWTRRITGYKRLDVLVRVLMDPAMKRQFVESDTVLLIGGRIHQHDDLAQTLIYNLLDLISQDRVLQERVVVIDNFSAWLAPRFYQGADAAIMLADDGREASATGFMKAQLNGGLVIATRDGAIPESVIFSGQEKPGQIANGFEVPCINGHPSPEGLLRAFKALRQVQQDPSQRAAMKRSAFSAQRQVSIDRTVEEMLLLYQRILSVPSTT